MSCIDYTLGLDISGSTNQNTNYWLTVESIYKQYNITKIIVWNTDVLIIDSSELLDIIKKKKGSNGTCISNFASKLINENIKDNIILITDGQVPLIDVDKTDKLFDSKNYKINNILCYILHNGNYDYSVIAPFRRNNVNYVYEKNTYYNLELKLVHSITLDDIELINRIDSITLDTFKTNFTQIENCIIAQTMGKSNEELKIKLIKLKKRIIQELSQKSSFEEDTILISLEKNKDIPFDSISYDPWIKVLEIVSNYDNNKKGSEIENNINRMISYCNNNGILNYNELINYSRLNNAQISKQEEIQELVENNDSSNICPISLDNDTIVIMIYEGESIFSSLNKNEIDYISNNPLNILNMPLVIESIKKRIGHSIGLKTLKEMDNKLMDFNPFNRQKIIGCITFENEIEYIKYSNYIIRLLFSNGKIIGNITFYYTVLYFIIKDIDFIDENIKQLTMNHLIYRYKNTKTFMSCCGLGNYITVKVNVASAIFYIVNSGLLNLDKNENILRYHLSCIQYMIKILEILNYPINNDALKHIDYQIALSDLLKKCKEYRYFNILINGLYKNMIKLNNYVDNNYLIQNDLPLYIEIDGIASKTQINEILDLLPSICKKLTINEIVTLSNMVYPNLSLGDIKLNIKLNIINIKFNSHNENVWNYTIPDNFKPISICLSTGRPFYNIQDKNWIDINKSLVGIILSKQFNGYKYALEYIIKYNKFPTKFEYILYCSKKHLILPKQIEYFYDIINRSYQQFNEYYDIHNLEKLYGPNNNFKNIKSKIIIHSCAIKNRIILEKQEPEECIKKYLN